MAKIVVELISRLITPRLQWHGFLLAFAQLGGEGVVIQASTQEPSPRPWDTQGSTDQSLSDNPLHPFRGNETDD